MWGFLAFSSKHSALAFYVEEQRNPLLQVFTRRLPLMGWKSLLATCGQNRQGTHCLNHGVMLIGNRERSLGEWATFTALETGLGCNLIHCETTGIISCKKSVFEEKWQKVGLTYNLRKIDLISPILACIVEVWELCWHFHLKKRNSSTS